MFPIFRGPNFRVLQLLRFPLLGCPNPCEGPPSLWLPTFGFPIFEGPNFQSPPPQKWRPFCLRFEGLVEDFNYGTLLRLDSRREYSEENTIFGEKRGLRGRGRTPNPQIHPGVDLFPFFQPPGSSFSPSRSPGTGRAATTTFTAGPGRHRRRRNQDEDLGRDEEGQEPPGVPQSISQLLGKFWKDGRGWSCFCSSSSCK